jgi:hypothetical protein
MYHNYVIARLGMYPYPTLELVRLVRYGTVVESETLDRRNAVQTRVGSRLFHSEGEG